MKNLSLLFVALLFLHLTTFAQWTQKADIPTARSWIESCTIDGKIYVIGGTESTSCNGPSVGTMEVYDPIPDSWDTTKDPMPTSRVEFCACAVNGKIYAIGGATNHGASPFGMVEEYDTLTGNWITKTPMPTPRKGAAYGVIDNKIYVAGGTAVANWTASNKLEIYDPVTDTWIDTLATMPIPMYQPTGAVINDTFYVIGGLLGYSPWTGQGTVQMYDPITDNWLLRADLNHPRVGPTANVVAGKIYAIGGDKQPPIVRIVEEYDPNSNSWTDIDSLPFLKILHTASVFENKIYLFSGSTTSVCNLTPTSTVYSFDIPVGVETQDNNIPENFVLYQNYPNPFNPNTKIKYSIPDLSFVTLKVFDVLGSEVVTLANEEKGVGTYELTWYADNLPSGVYFYQLKAGSFVETKKMLLLK